MYQPYGSPYGYNPQMQMYGNQVQNINYQQLQQQQIIRVNGENGARAFQLAPNSSVLLLDESAPIVWLVSTDGAGYRTAKPFDISEHITECSVNNTEIQSLTERIEKLERELMKRESDSQSDATKQRNCRKAATDKADG